MNPIEIILLVLLILISLLLVLLYTKVHKILQGEDNQNQQQFQAQIWHNFSQQMQAQERTERSLQEQLLRTSQGTREELMNHLTSFQQTLATQMTSVATVQNNQIDQFAKQLEQMRESSAQQAQTSRDEQANILKRFGDTLHQNLNTLTESNANRLTEIRATLEQKIQQLQTENAHKLEEMRKTVDEKLHATLEQRLGESFKLVSERLENVHKSLGEMQSLTIGVNDLKRAFTNVKTRGTWGEVLLENLIEQVFTKEQYEKQCNVNPSTQERVDFAIKFPGKDGVPTYLSIDSKFPIEQYDRILSASEIADKEALEKASKELIAVMRQEAKSIKEKYICEPYTLNYAILYLPTEGLYAEALRIAGLSDELQRDYRVVLAGPHTLLALLNSFQMGFRTMALEKRSTEVWEVLGAVKTEFAKFGDALAVVKKSLQAAAEKIEKTEVRTRAMSRAMKNVESLSQDQAQAILPYEQDDSSENSEEALNDL